MSNYSDIVQNAKNLQEQFENKLTAFEALQIASKIQMADVISDSFQTGYKSEPAFLEAIAMQLGYKKNGGTAISGSYFRISLIETLINFKLRHYRLSGKSLLTFHNSRKGVYL